MVSGGLRALLLGGFEASKLHALRKGHYTEGAELIDSVLDVVRKEAEGCDCLQLGEKHRAFGLFMAISSLSRRCASKSR